MIAAIPPAHYLPDPEKLFEIGVRLALTLAGAVVLQQIAFLLVARVEHWVSRAGHESEEARQRARTVRQIFRNLATTVVWAGAFVHGLEVFGWDVKPLLAGAGILGVALGFGAQTLVRDIIAGFFILVENQYGVGDLIDVNGQAAQVEEVTLRYTRLRNFNGYVHYVPNGEIKTVTNRSRGWTRLAVDVPVGAQEDVDRALAVCRGVVDAMNQEPAWHGRLMEPIELWGVESLAGTEVQLRMVLRAKPGPDAWQAARELRRRAHAALVEGEIRTRTSRDIAITPVPTGDAATPAGRAPSDPDEFPPSSAQERT